MICLCHVWLWLWLGCDNACLGVGFGIGGLESQRWWPAIFVTICALRRGRADCAHARIGRACRWTRWWVEPGFRFDDLPLQGPGAALLPRPNMRHTRPHLQFGVPPEPVLPPVGPRWVCGAAQETRRVPARAVSSASSLSPRPVRRMFRFRMRRCARRDHDEWLLGRPTPSGLSVRGRIRHGSLIASCRFLPAVLSWHATASTRRRPSKVCLVGDQSFFARTGSCVALLNLSWLRKLASELLS